MSDFPRLPLPSGNATDIADGWLMHQALDQFRAARGLIATARRTRGGDYDADVPWIVRDARRAVRSGRQLLGALSFNRTPKP